MQKHSPTDEQVRILRYWWMLELLSPQKVPQLKSLSPQNRDEQVVAWAPDDPLPWENLEPPRPNGKTERVWVHTVYLGVYDLSEIYESLHRVFHDDADSYEIRPPGQSACSGLQIDYRGQLIGDSQVLSSALWAIGRAGKAKPREPDWADGFDTVHTGFVEAVAAFEAARLALAAQTEAANGQTQTTGEFSEEQPPPPPIEKHDLLQLLRLSHSHSGVWAPSSLITDRIFIKSAAVIAKSEDDSHRSDFLNSFYLADIEKVRTSASQGSFSGPLRTYLTGDDSLPLRNRIDVLKSSALVDSETSISRLPLGRWPSNPKHHLALSQQFAVNNALRERDSGQGLFGVNGPPGTGKTTMLRDILAGNVVERARRLASLDCPKAAFTRRVYTWNVEGRPDAKLPQLIEDLTGFEMVVTSANNAAVENISLEIPAEGAIAEQWQQDADYFKDIATFILREGANHKSGDDGLGAWGLVAAKLGSKAHRRQFRSAFWFREKDPKTKQPVEGGCLGMEETLRRLLSQKRSKTWTEARESFLDAEERVNRLIKQGIEAEHRQERLRALRLRLSQFELQIEVEQQEIERIRMEYGHCSKHEERARDTRDRVLAHYRRHTEEKPRFLEVLFSFGQVLKPWRSMLNELANDLLKAEDSLEHAQDALTRNQGDFHLHADNLRTTEGEVIRTQDELASLSEQCTIDEQLYGASYPGERWIGDNRELCAPWLNDELDAARSELFFAALQLHKDFIVGAGYKFLDGLRAAVSVVGGESPPNLSPDKVKAAWQLFFLVVPLVSTTFASAGRMFDNLDDGSLGWLFIDEAGQAPPQYAVGSIMRSKRVVAVGDPLQLQPVVTIPPKAQRDIALTLGISKTWSPPEASVQTLADRVTSRGTTLRQEEHAVWVGAPLRVHRRCDDPMFSLCNAIAYGGMMVNGVHHKSDDSEYRDPFDGPEGYRIFPSYWADHPAPQSGTHLQVNQITQFEKALEYLQEKGVGPSDVIAISPFREVANRLESLTYKYPGLTAGTIHTAQGREAPVVFLVLGGDPEKSGAKAWAAASVNLVNVAASRAQRRLFVIGDESTWSKFNYFRQLSAELGRPVQKSPNRAD